MMTDTARRKRNVGAQLLPEAQPACVTCRVFLCFDAPELGARRTVGFCARQSAPLEVIRAMLNMASVFLVHFPLDRRAIEKTTEDRANAMNARSHSVSVVARSAAVMPATTCCQLERSARSCFRPSGVSE